MQQEHLLTTEIRTEWQTFATSAELCQKNKPNILCFITTIIINVMAVNSSTSSCAEPDLRTQSHGNDSTNRAGFESALEEAEE